MNKGVRITRTRISPESVLRLVKSRAAGGTVSFIGTVRNSSEKMTVSAIELEAAEDLARKDLNRIAAEALARFQAEKIAITHRIGRLEVGDVIVVIAVSAAHRRQAFAACRYVIDELKKTTPIWKKEFSGKRQKWVGVER